MFPWLILLMVFILNEEEEEGWIWQRKDRFSLSAFQEKPHAVPTSHLGIFLLFASSDI